jgi:SAM-dependent methyltransferase
MNCGGKNLHEFLDLGRQPNGNNFPTDAEKASEVAFPLLMLVCSDCWQVQIDELPSQELMFSDHAYITGVNAPVVSHFRNLVPHVIAKLGLQPNDLAIDVGCNDGTLLGIFAERGLRVLGVDPSKRTGELARQNGVTVFRTFWNSVTGRALRALHIEPQVITATAVFYHVPDLHDFLAGLTEVMGPRTVFVVQGVNLKDLIERNEFDHFYHEHSCIHSVLALRPLLKKHGLRIFDVEFSEIHGGSFILYVVREDHASLTTSAVEKAVAAERAAGLDRLETYIAFAGRVRANMRQLKALLIKLKSEGKRVFALGAPVKGSTLLNYAGIGADLIECATEVNQFKVGRLTPGTHIPIVNELTLSETPDYYLVLSWNFLDFLREKYDVFLRGGGRFIVPVPDVAVVGPKD